MSSWFSSISTCDVPVIQRMLEQQHAHVDHTDQNGMTGLMHACSLPPSSFADSHALVSLLLLHSSDVNLVDGSSRTALHYATMSGNTQVAKLLLKYGADISIADNEGKTVLDITGTPNQEEIQDILRNSYDDELDVDDSVDVDVDVDDAGVDDGSLDDSLDAMNDSVEHDVQQSYDDDGDEDDEQEEALTKQKHTDNIDDSYVKELEKEADNEAESEEASRAASIAYSQQQQELLQLQQQQQRINHHQQQQHEQEDAAAATSGNNNNKSNTPPPEASAAASALSIETRGDDHSHAAAAAATTTAAAAAAAPSIHSPSHLEFVKMKESLQELENELEYQKLKDRQLRAEQQASAANNNNNNSQRTMSNVPALTSLLPTYTSICSDFRCAPLSRIEHGILGMQEEGRQATLLLNGCSQHLVYNARNNQQNNNNKGTNKLNKAQQQQNQQRLQAEAHIDDTSIYPLMETLSYHFNSYPLHTLDLSYNHIHSTGANAIATYLSLNHTLLALNLQGNDIDAKGCKVLLNALLSNASSALTKLILHSNPLAGAHSDIAAFLEHNNNSSLTHLDIGNTECDTIGLMKLSSALSVNHHLRHLNLDSPLLYSQQDETTIYLARNIANNHGLHSLSLQSHGLSDSSVQWLADYLQQNHVLTELNVRRNKISLDGVLLLIHAAVNRAVELVVYLDGNLLKGQTYTRINDVVHEVNAQRNRNEIVFHWKDEKYFIRAKAPLLAPTSLDL